MKKWIYSFIILGAMPLSGVAQDDDMYFVPTKENLQRERAANVSRQYDGYYSGSMRSVDEYNRRNSNYEVLPADTGDIISFAAVEGVYPDSVSDFQLTQQMARWDGYEPEAEYWAGYYQGRNDSWSSWGWHSPWYYSSYYPWYDSWYWNSWYYDPWYYGSWRYGWYDPWYYGRYGWGGYYSSWYYRPYHYYHGGFAGRTHYGRPGTQNHGRISGVGGRGRSNGRTYTYGSTTFGNGRSFGNGTRSGQGGSRTVGGTRSYGNTGGGTYSNSNGNFGGSRSSSSSSGSYGSTRSSGSSGGSFSSGGGGSRSSGGSFGGSRSSGGGGSRSGGGGFGSGRR